MIDITNIEYASCIFEQELNSIIHEQMMNESEFMLSCLENNIILEADENGKTLRDTRLRKLIEDMINFFSNIANSFANKIKEFAEVDKKWLDDNKGKLESINYDGLDVTITKYWDGDTTPGAILAYLKEFSDLLNANNIPTQSKLDKDKTPISKLSDKYKILKEFNGDEFKSLFIGGKDGKIEQVKLASNELKNLCTGEFLDYVTKYPTDVNNNIKNQINTIKTKMKSAQNAIKSSGALNESYCLLENAMYSNTELRYCYNYKTLLEAEENKGDDIKKTGELKINDSKKDEKKPENNEEDYSDLSTDALKYLNKAVRINQLAVGTAMNVLEERYRVYMRVLRGVVSARK